MNIFQPGKNAGTARPTMKITREMRRVVNEVNDDNDVEIIGGASYMGGASWNAPRRVIVMQQRPKNGVDFI